MDHQYLQQPYSAFLTNAKSELSREALLAEEAITRARPSIAGMSTIKLIAFFDYHTSGLLGNSDRLKDNASVLRDKEIGEAQAAHVRTFGSITAEDNDRLIHNHQDCCSRLGAELDRHLDFLLGALINVITGFIPDQLVEEFRKAPLLALKNGNAAGISAARIDRSALAVLVLLLFLGTMHAGAALIALTSKEWAHALAFLLVNWGVMAIRFFDLVLRSRNGTFEKGLHFVEVVISAVLIGLILNNCWFELASAEDWNMAIHRVINEILLGGGTVLLFHKLVSLLVRRLRDWKDRGKRMW